MDVSEASVLDQLQTDIGQRIGEKNEQHRIKTSWVTQAFSPFITANTTLIPLNAQAQEYAGRRRVRWFVKKQQLGFRKRLSHDIIHTSQCIALSQSLDALRNQLEISLSTLPASLQSIQAIELSNGSHIILESEQDKPTELNLPALSGCNCWWRKIGTPSIKLISSASPALFDNIDLRPFADSSIEIEIGPNDFIQGQQQGNQELIEQILRWSKGSKRVVDLFCGAGNLSLPVASALGAKVIGAEANASSVKAANANAKRLKLDADYQLLDLFGQFATEPFIGADTLILDPPRKGAKRICKMMASLFPKQVIMVNCDVASGARDAQALHQAGFRLQELRPLDLFPYTGHVEVLSLWKP